MNAPTEAELSTRRSELLAVLHRQREAFLGDMSPSRPIRADRLNRLDRLLETHADRFADLIQKDFGVRSRTETVIAEVMLSRAAIRHAGKRLRAWMKPRRAPTSLAFWPGRSLLLRQPLGVIGIISPWNYTLQLAVGPLTDALAAGNRVMIKPSELTPLFSEAFRAAVAEFFAPEEVAIVTGDAGTGKEFSALPFDHLVFTGSTAVGRIVAEAAAKNLTPVTLELGGKSPAIIDASCDLSSVCDRLAWGKLINAGQTCVAPDYALVPRTQVEAFAQALQSSIRKLFPSFQGNPDYTSIISERHLERLRDLVTEAKTLGARVIEPEPPQDLPAGARQMAPILLIGVNDQMRVMREEIFGPILPIVPYDALDDAIDYVNRRDRPLALYWFGADRANRDAVLAKTISGGVSINDTLTHFAQHDLPFGGVGASGHGHYHGEYGFLRFSKEKPVFVQSRLSGASLIYPPYKPSLGALLRVLARFT
ncbi:coniferyl aldehyde dehydrogenase [Methylocella tundrae]|uniref:Aldehyde dehydrogenase n=1 Tax=Methylocella tundrae TaxID=227605 RepID=A0A4U8Z1M2_METTU|nr:coniferyl aldehyde dehydrogenase [Methylocella tundrae]WPP03167.1 coniferyl aldehyde dehydrogenase [Methylocella tundrae]VFU09154.1 putative coniferyl aldehyde dehydrogenase [Methylocella tundrae]